MKRSMIWIAAGAAGVGLGVPAYAAMSPHDGGPRIVPAPTVASVADDDPRDDSATAPSTPSTAVSTPVNSTPNSTPTSTPVSTPDTTTANTTANTVEDISGPCDEAEHANDPRCTSAAGNDDSSGRRGGGHGSDDSSGSSGRGHGGDD